MKSFRYDEERWFLLERKTTRNEISLDISTNFTELEIELILFKGWAVARYYPSGKGRQYNDIDLAVSAEDFEMADELSHSEELQTMQNRSSQRTPRS